jgi:hypothetical protein
MLLFPPTAFGTVREQVHLDREIPRYLDGLVVGLEAAPRRDESVVARFNLDVSARSACARSGETSGRRRS